MPGHCLRQSYVWLPGLVDSETKAMAYRNGGAQGAEAPP